MNFGDRVKKARKFYGMSQYELARSVGITRQYLSNIERGKATGLSYDLRMKLLSALGIQEEMEPPSPAIIEFSQEEGLPKEDANMLSRIFFRGRGINTLLEAKVIYSVIKAVLG